MLTTAVLNRTKEQTRRLEKELDRLVSEYQMRYEEPIRIVEQKWDKDKNCLLLYAHSGIADTDREHVLTLKTRYKLGEVVSVAQSYEDIYHHGGPEYGSYELVNNYRRLHIRPWKDITQQAGWNNKMFVRPDLMPHQIQITDIKIERLQAISEEDCLKEGIRLYTTGIPQCKTVVVGSLDYIPAYGFDDYHHKRFCNFDTPREAFAALINRPGVGRKGLWESNPFVVVYEFKLIK